MEKISLTADFGLSGLIEKYIRQLFEDKQVSEENREKLWAHYYGKLSAGIDEGYSPDIEFYDADLANSLKQSIAEFSAFKETSFRKTLEDLLTKNGKLTPWNDFKKEAFKVSGDYNHRWLEAEYHQTVANANMAQTWKEFGENADLYPNVKLVSVRDARVRPEHKVLDGTIRPYNDPFWDTHLPPLDWGCRCHIEQTDEEPTEVKGGVQMRIEFENNPAKSGKIFGGSAYAENLSNAEKKQAETNAKEWSATKEDRRAKDAEILQEFVKKVKKGTFQKIISAALKNEVRISKSALQNTLNHIRGLEQKEISLELESVLKDAEFIKSEPLDLSKDTKNIGKKIGRGVVSYSHYKAEWRNNEVEIIMEVMKNGYEQPYAIRFK